MKIDHLLQRTKAQDPKKNQQLENAGKETAEGNKAAGKDETLKVDTVTISDQARSLQRTQTELKTFKDGLETLESRQERIEFIKNQIANGTYKVDDKLIEGTAEAILKSGALGDLVNAEHPLARARLAEAGTLESDPDKLARVRQRIESGFYNSDEVTDTIAERMLEDLLN
ncbi:MAG: flagellar biosynthesis anti-sigma factor FlgM [Candidatus Glassbacteria bacterium]|nr:flagellar biosynthesis anti-sigma factor FlgM [Candidatus Glassbacteria bacterium]